VLPPPLHAIDHSLSREQQLRVWLSAHMPKHADDQLMRLTAG
jgi:hypothetical protein